MGIDKQFFIDPNHNQFLCVKCNDVAQEPVLTTCCEECYCTSCFAIKVTVDGNNCSSCHDTYPENKTKKLQRQLGDIYSKLRMRCKEPTCDEVLTVRTFDEHIKNCPNKPFNCNKCGLEGKWLDKDTHDCVEWLKSQNLKLSYENEALKRDAMSSQSEMENLRQDLINTKITAQRARSNSRQRSNSRNRIGSCSGACRAKIQEAQDQTRTIKRRLTESYAQRDELEKKLQEIQTENGGNRYCRSPPALNGVGDGGNRYDYCRSPPAPNGAGDGQFQTSSKFVRGRQVNSTRVEINPNGRQVNSIKVEINPKKTTATEEIVEALVELINVAEFKNKSDRQKYDFVNRGLVKRLGGKWISLPADEFNPGIPNISPNTFCQYTYEGRESVTFQLRVY